LLALDARRLRQVRAGAGRARIKRRSESKQKPNPTKEETKMTEIENVEMARYHREIVEDLRHMLKKYGRIMEWDVPDAVDEGATRTLILESIKSALAEVEAEA
jgi:hypothetical protein